MSFDHSVKSDIVIVPTFFVKNFRKAYYIGGMGTFLLLSWAIQKILWFMVCSAVRIFSSIFFCAVFCISSVIIIKHLRR